MSHGKGRGGREERGGEIKAYVLSIVKQNSCDAD